MHESRHHVGTGCWLSVERLPAGAIARSARFWSTTATRARILHISSILCLIVVLTGSTPGRMAVIPVRQDRVAGCGTAIAGDASGVRAEVSRVAAMARVDDVEASFLRAGLELRAFANATCDFLDRRRPLGTCWLTPYLVYRQRSLRSVVLVGAKTRWRAARASSKDRSRLGDSPSRQGLAPANAGGAALPGVTSSV
jgi:hypothetical protein